MSNILQRSKIMKQHVVAFAKNSGITLKVIPNVTLRVLRDKLVGPNGHCHDMKLDGRKPTGPQKQRHSNDKLQRLFQQLLTDGARVQCRQHIGNQFVKEVLCGEKTYSHSPNVTVALHSIRTNQGAPVMQVLGFAVWGDWSNDVPVNNVHAPDNWSLTKVALKEKDNRGRLGQNIPLHHRKYAELSLLCSRADVQKPTGRTLLAYALYDIYRRQSKGQQKYSGVHLTVPSSRTHKDFAHYASDVRKGGAFKLYDKFGFKEIYQVLLSDLNSKPNGFDLRYPDFHMLLRWQNSDQFVINFKKQIALSEDMMQICHQSPKCI